MGYSLGGSNGTDWSKYTNVFAKSYTVSQGGVESSFATILNVTGKGYLKKALVLNTVNSSQSIAHIKITIDGVVTVLTKSSTSGTNNWSGFFCDDCIASTGTTYLSTVAGSAVVALDFTGLGSTIDVSYPNTTNTIPMVRSPQPIFFNSSLKIEVSASNSGFEYAQVDYATM